MQSEGIQRILKERERQITAEGWSADHDDLHDNGELALVAALYATPKPMYGKCNKDSGGVLFFDPWPWDDEWDKRTKHSRIRSLEIAGALIAAEIDRLLRKEGDIKEGDRA